MSDSVMENPHDSNTPIILKLKLNCCDKCPKTVEKILNKIHGVHLVEVYQESDLVVVAGNVDSKMLIDAINSKGKEATVGCLEDLKQCIKNNIHDDDHCAEDNHDGVAVRRAAARRERCHQEEYNTVAGNDKCPQNGYFEQRPERKGKKCYCKGDPNYNRKKKDEDDHVVENFENLENPEETTFEEVDEEICKDRFCPTHRRKHSGVPPVHDRSRMYWDHQPFGGMGTGYFPAGLRNPQGMLPPTIRELPQLALPPYGPFSYVPSPYGNPSSSMPPPFRSRRPPFGNHYYGDYGEANGGCAPM